MGQSLSKLKVIVARKFLKQQKRKSFHDVKKSSVEGNILSLQKLEKRFFALPRNTRAFLLSGTTFVLIAVLMISFSPKTSAEISVFYPTACLGGWENPHNAENKSETDDNEKKEQFTKENAAVLKSDVNADLYCGNFTGEIPENTRPTKVTFSLQWTVKDEPSTQNVTSDSYASSTLTIMDATSSATTTFTLLSATTSEPEESSSTQESTSSEMNSSFSPTTVIDYVREVVSSLIGDATSSNTSATTTPPPEPGAVVPTEVAPDTNVTPVEASSSPTSLYLRNMPLLSQIFFEHAYAETVAATETPTEVQGSSSEPIIETASSSEETEGSLQSDASTTASSTEGDIVLPKPGEQLLEVLYTYDGKEWFSLGTVGESQLAHTNFSIPTKETTSWSDMSNIQVRIKKIESIDVVPTIYLDGMKLDISYEASMPRPHPDFSRDSIIEDKSDGGIHAISIINSDTNQHQIWYTTIDEQGDFGVAPGAWVRLDVDQNNSSAYRLIEVYGENLFWVDDSQKILWVTHLIKGGNEGVALNVDGVTEVPFIKANGENWVLEYDNTTKSSVVHIVK